MAEKTIHDGDMEKLVSYIKKHGGYARMKDLRAASFQTREIASLVKKGLIEKVKPGLYRLADIGASGANIGFTDVCRAMPEGVICLLSALDYYGLTTFNPSEVYVAIPHAAKAPGIEYPPVKVFYFRDRFYVPGIEQVQTPLGLIKIYNMEKTICDMFRYRKKLGEDLAIEGLKNYLKRKDANINRLREYAKICHVKTVLFPYLKAMLVR